uniref:Dirigent protein n=1 Tax=Rhizophora mucronata TaxID=61149 RepID=A0A2P2Q8Y2_RHIMU
MGMSYSFVDGIYNGSSFSLLGKNPPMKPAREMPIVGGTGLFRFARGYAIAHTLSLNAAGDAVVGYNVTILVDSNAAGGNNNDGVDNTNTPGNNPNTRTVDASNFSPSASVFLNHLSVVIFSTFLVYCIV